MAILPVQAATQMARAGAAAVTAVSAGFADLLQAAVKPVATSVDGASGPTGGSSPAGSTQGETDVAALRRRTDELTQTFHERLNRLLAEEGIQVSGGFHLQLDDFEQVQVAGRHPEKRRIEQVIESHPELADLFRAIAVNSVRLRAAEEGAAGVEQTFNLYLDHQQAEPSFVAAGSPL